MKHILLTLLLTCILGFTLLAQVTVSGVITEAGSDIPLPGVSVVEKGTTNGSTTDFDGKYELTLVNSAAILVYSFIGYSSQELAINGSGTFNINLEEDIAKLDEVVVIGYGVQKKAVVTGAISKVTSDALEDQPVSRIEQSLQGRTSGVRVTTASGQPGEGSTVRIRGTTSINGSEPLYVVDGVPIGGGIDFLNQGDIESIEVLKDAASASIYGTRASAGVILVTTKKGSSEKPKVGYNSYYGLQSPWRKLAVLNGTEYATLMNESSVASGGSVLYDDPASYGEGTDWQEAVFNYNAPILNHEINLSAGNKKSTYYASFGYFNQQGIVSENDSNWKRFAARVNSDHKVNSRIKIGNSLAYARIKASGVGTNDEWGSPLGRAINLDPLTPILETDAAVLESTVFTEFPVVVNEDGIPYGISDRVTSEILNPLAALEVQQGTGYSDKVVANIFGEIEILKDLKFRSSAGADLAFWGGEGFTPLYYLNSSNQNTITRYNRSQNRGLNWILTNTLSYDRSFGRHNLGLVAGTVGERSGGQGINGNVQDIPVDNLEDASLGFSTSPESQTFGGFEYQGTLASYLGRMNYNFAEKYLLSATLRVDGSSKFGSNNKWGYFPSVSLGWVVTEEKFLNTNNAINFLKLRGSWGVNGSDQIGDFRYVSTVSGGRNYTFGLDETYYNGVSPNAIANPDLKWERTSQANVGIDAKIFKKMSVTIDLFDKVTSGMLLDIQVPGYVGNAGPVGNIASMSNKGIELEVGYGNRVNLFNYDISGNISYVKNEVTDIGQDKEFLGGATFGPSGAVISRTEVGQPIGFFYGYTTDGIFQNQSEIDAYVNSEGDLIQPDAKPGDFKWQDINADGAIDDEDRGFIGDPTPKWTYGGFLELNWRGFTWSTFGQGAAGNQIFKALRRWDLPGANMEGAALDRWTGDGTTNEYPRLTMDDTNGNFSRSSDFYLESGNYFRVKSMQLGYTLPRVLLDRVDFGKIYVYVGAYNLFTFTKYTGFDPEIGGGSYGIDRVFYPQPRAYMLGINASF